VNVVKHLGKVSFWIILCMMLASICVSAHAQRLEKPRIGYLFGLSPSASTERVEAFRQGLHALGYVEGKNIFIEYRWADGEIDRLPDLASELVRLKVNAIVTAGPTPTRFAKQATVAIPIVMAWDSDPVGNGFVSSLARPGGNITGLSTLAPEISGKQLELLKQIVPKLSRVAVLGTSTVPGNSEALRSTQLAAKTFGLQLNYLDIRDPHDVETAFKAARAGSADAVLALASRVIFSQRLHIVDVALKSRLPTVFGDPELVQAGGLATYGVSINDLFRRTATYVDKILKGAKPADLPVEQPTKFELVINLRTAKQIGLTIPPNVLARADRVIK
jgi:putative tryptophan/tyrosine transport system substrate-binding protein